MTADAPLSGPVDQPDSRERILIAGSAEFRAKGFAGARVDEIARLANCNKNLIYYYFNDKAGLYAASLQRMVSRSHEELGLIGDVDRDALEWLQQLAAPARDASADWRRLWLWEAADGITGDVTPNEERVAVLGSYVQKIADAQTHGVLRTDLDPAQLGLALLALGNFAQMFPQLTQLVTGLQADDPEFLSRQNQFFIAFTEAISAAPQD